MIDKLIETGGCYGMEMNVEKTKLMIISRQPFPVKIMIDQKQLENAESFKYLGKEKHFHYRPGVAQRFPGS